MQASVNGFTWEMTPGPADGSKWATREEALAVLEKAPRGAASTRWFHAAWAAYELRDYDRAIACAEAAAEQVSPERWR